MALTDLLFATGVIALFLYPILYLFYFKLTHGLLFLAACYGLEQIISLLLIGLLSPLFILDVFAFPQLEANGDIENLRWLVTLTHYAGDYWYWITPVVLLATPTIVHKRYTTVFTQRTGV